MRNAFIALVVSAVAAPSHGGGASLTLLDVSLATDVTVDEFGRTLVLTGSVFGIGPVYIYEDGIYNYIGDGFGQSISVDGTVVCGNFVNSNDDEEAARWTNLTGWVGLGQLPTGLTCPSISSGYSISADGLTASGLAWKDGCNARAFKWTEETGMVEMDLAGVSGNRGSHISDDGSLIVGFARDSFNRSPVAWNANDGTVALFNPAIAGEFYSTTPDGSTIVGSAGLAPNTAIAVYYSACTNLVPLGTLPPNSRSDAYDVSTDGTTIVGSSGSTFEGFRAFVWTPRTGMKDLQQVLVDAGVTIPPGVQLEIAVAVSPDGRTVVGRAIDPSIKGGFPFAGFIATLPEIEPCPADFNGDGAVGFGDLTDLLAAWGPCTCPGPIACPEDLTGDDAVGFADLTDLLAAWGPC